MKKLQGNSPQLTAQYPPILVLPQKMEMLKPKSLCYTKFRGEKHIHTVSLVNLKQYYKNSKLSKYF